MLLGGSQVLERPLDAIEALQGAQEACGGIGGRGTPSRADCGQQLGECGQEPGHDGWGRAALDLGLERVETTAYRALGGRMQERLALVGPEPAGWATGHLRPQAAQGGA